MKSTDSVIVSWDFSHGKDVGVLIVGKQEKGKVEIINAYLNIVLPPELILN